MKSSRKELIKSCGTSNKYVKAHTGVGCTQIYHPTNLQATPEEATGIINDYRRNAANAAPNKAIFSNFKTSAELLSPATGVGALEGGNLEGKLLLGNGGLVVGELATALIEGAGPEATGETDGGDGGDEIGDENVVGVTATGDGALLVGGDARGLTVGLLAFFGEVTGDAVVVVVVGAPAVTDGAADGDCAQHEEPIKLTITNNVTATALVPAIVSDSKPQSPSRCLKA